MHFGHFVNNGDGIPPQLPTVSNYVKEDMILVCVMDIGCIYSIAQQKRPTFLISNSPTYAHFDVRWVLFVEIGM